MDNLNLLFRMLYQFKKNIGLILLQLFCLAILSSCVSYNLSDNTKYREYLPSKDDFIVSQTEFDKHEFNIEQFLNPDTLGSVQFILPEHINKISNALESDFLVLLFQPYCSGAWKDMELVRAIEQLEIPFILVSFIYRPEAMNELYSAYNLNNKNQYIIPSFKNKSNFYLDKILNFTKGICSDCYEINKDDLIFTKIIYVSNSREADVYPKLINGYVQQEKDLEWIKKKFDINE